MKIPLPGLTLFTVLGVAALAPLRAQQEQMILDPPLGQAFPIDLKSDGVRLRFPVLLNDHTIVSPDAVLRFIYLDPNAGYRHSSGGGGDDDDNGPHSHIGTQGTVVPDQQLGGNTHGEEAGGGWGKNDQSDTDGLFDDKEKPNPKRDKSELEHEVWTQPDLFVDALDHASELGTTLVYRRTGDTHSQTASFDLPEGMLLAEVDGHVRVLALTHDSRAYAAGIRPGDEILAFGEGTRVATLEDFIRGYIATKHQAKVSGNPSYSMEVREAETAPPITIQIAAPPSIPSFF
jgi:hypothetical protein